MPERASLQVNRTRTALLNHPAAFALRGDPSLLTVAPLIVGGVRSILKPVTDADPKLPALSKMVTGPAPRLEPSPVTTLSAGWVAGSIPESASSPVHVIVTLPLYHPAAFAFVVGAPLSVGFVRSMLTFSTLAEFVFPALSVACPM
jgi:hypothetical protein